MTKPRKLLLLLMMLLLPLQGVAAAFAPMLMARHSAGDASALAAMPCHEHAGAPQASAADVPMSETTHDNGPANHLCCHQVLSCAPSFGLPATAQKFSDVSRFVLPLATLFIPDSPDRPPRG